MTREISSKSTKNEIMEAYEELLNKVKNSKPEDPRKEQEQKKNQDLVKTASSQTFDGVVTQMASLKVQLTSAIDKLSENLTTEYQKFADLQKAIAIEKENLQNLYQLSVETDSLAAMLLAQKERKAQFDAEMLQTKQAFDSEMTEKRALWKKEQEQQAQQQKEYEENLKKTRKRDEDEYAYNLAQQRKKEADTHNEKREAKERELAQREAIIKTAETELTELRKQVASFPKDLELAVKQAEQAVTQKLTTQYEFEKQLNAKQLEGELKLNNQIIASLKDKIKDMETSLKELTSKAAAADAGVKDIALKALETSKVRTGEGRKMEE
jgi:hypothetical protein